MIPFLYIILISAFLILFALGTWLLIIVFGSKEEPENADILINFMSHFDSGHFIGFQLKDQGAKDGRHFIKMLPKDVDVNKDPKETKEIPIIVDKNKLYSLPRGSASQHRNVNILLPKHASDLHEAVKNSTIGKGLMMAIELDNAANAEIQSLLEGHERKDEVLKRIGHAEIPKVYLNLIDELYHDSLKLALDAKGKDKGSLLPSLASTVKREM